MTIFERIKELADKQGKSLQKVSEDLGLSQNYIYNLKGAKSPAADKLALIADYFNVSVDYLMGRSDYTDNTIIIDKTLKFLREQWSDKDSELEYPEEIESLSDYDKLTVELAESFMILQTVFEQSNTDQRKLLNEWISRISLFFIQFGAVDDKSDKVEKEVFDNFNSLFEIAFKFLSQGYFNNGKYTPMNYDELLGKLNHTAIDFIKVKEQLDVRSKEKFEQLQKLREITNDID
ncbi:helix-turn-helix domain-containing protein [Lactococcus lactis]|uniref:helix-turn-helix domain-containing protein n=1 Tax=Lactococcus lactis TaxID=1358 RepID=UPI003A4E0588